MITNLQDFSYCAIMSLNISAVSNFNTIIKQRCVELYAGISDSSVNYFLRLGSYWAKGSTSKPLCNAAKEPKTLFPVALSKDGGKKGITAVKLGHKCPRQTWWSFVPAPLASSCRVTTAIQFQKSAMAAMAASRRLCDLQTWRELPLDLWVSVALSCCCRGHRMGRAISSHACSDPLKLSGPCIPLQKAPPFYRSVSYSPMIKAEVTDKCIPLILNSVSP